MSLAFPERSEPIHFHKNQCHPELVEGSVQFQSARVRDYFVYILSNNAQVLYIGVTSDLDGRLFEHIKERDPSSFVARYNLDRLVYYEGYPTAKEAIAREKQLKGWNRERKKRLIREMNPMWRNLLEDLKFGTVEIREERKSFEQKAGGTDPSTGSG